MARRSRNAGSVYYLGRKNDDGLKAYKLKWKTHTKTFYSGTKEGALDELDAFKTSIKKGDAAREKAAKELRSRAPTLQEWATEYHRDHMPLKSDTDSKRTQSTIAVRYVTDLLGAQKLTALEETELSDALRQICASGKVKARRNW